ncbi:PqqD family protein [Sellimonas caecigallum]|uniref:PqqD family protein n=1 Tax=Sellimonas caecigallum TaxID=2592333 RepID=A0ABS7L8R6_9FIRM|nr:PqqD family protein [Sellimonas caecigallum]MBY0759348.1 PqqD family protein [Sellimonas caecigallum]
MKIRENLMLCRLGEEFVIVFADKKGDSPRDPIVLNQMESVFWKMFRKGMTPDAIRRQIQEEYDVEPDVLEADWEEFLEKLRANKMLDEIDS